MKKFLAMALAGAMALSLAACGGAAGGKTESKGEPALPKNIEVQVPASAGGGTDVVARSLTAYMNENSGSNFTVVNNTDGAGVVACETARTGKADGSELLFFHSTMCIKTATGIYDKTAADDFKVIAVGTPTNPGGYVLVVDAASGITDVDGRIAAANDAAGTYKIGVETGGSSHIMSGMLSGALGITLDYVEAGSDTDKLTALVGGGINCALVNANQASQYIEAGKVNAIACFSATADGGRNVVLPDVPSFPELGYDCVFGTYFFVLANPDMDDATAKLVYDAWKAAATDPATLEILEGTGMAFEFVEQSEGKALIASQQEALNAAVEALGLKK